MFHPPKPIIFAPSFICSSKRGVCLRTGLIELLTILPPYVGRSKRQQFTADSIGVSGTDFTWPSDRAVRLLDRPTKNAVPAPARHRGGRTRQSPMSLAQTSSYARAA